MKNYISLPATVCVTIVDNSHPKAGDFITFDQTFSYNPNALEKDVFKQVTRMDTYCLTKWALDNGLITKTDLCGITVEGKMLILRKVRKGVAYNREQQFTVEQQEEVAYFTILGLPAAI
jgi:CRISPR/Cas system CMR-associated protein Cmr3 (group 5 of RAMP superfamily)